MTRIRIIVLALFAVFATSAVAVATASAEEMAKLVSAATKLETSTGFKGSGKKGTLETVAGNTITCTESKIEGKVTSLQESEATVTFKGCTAFSIVKCNSAKASAGEIVTKLSFYLGWEKKPETELVVKATILPYKTATVKLECGSTQELVVRGGAIILFGFNKAEQNTPIEEVETVGEQSKGKQASTEFFLLLEGAAETIELETEGIGKGLGGKTFAFEQSGEKFELVKLKFGEKVELVP
jgi:hypothetical protein